MSRSYKKTPVRKWSTDKKFCNRSSRRNLFKRVDLDVNPKDLKCDITDLCLTPLIEYLLYNERDIRRHEHEEQMRHRNAAWRGKPPKRIPRYKYYMK